jgi:hypothetical protein
MYSTPKDKRLFWNGIGKPNQSPQAHNILLFP